MMTFATELLTVANKMKHCYVPQKVKQRKKPLCGNPNSPLQEQLCKDLSEMVVPFLNSLPDKDYKDVYSETASEIQVI